MLSSLALTLLAVSITNTEAVHGLAPLGDRVVACTEGGLDVFSRKGTWLRTLHVEDGLPAHGCWAIRAVGESVFIATDRGMAEVDARLVVTKHHALGWHALPPGTTREALLARAQQLAASLPDDVTWTAFSEHFAGTADGRVVAVTFAPAVRSASGIADTFAPAVRSASGIATASAASGGAGTFAPAVRSASGIATASAASGGAGTFAPAVPSARLERVVPGSVESLVETPEGALEIGTTESAWVLEQGKLTERPHRAAPLAWSNGRPLSSDGFDGELALNVKAPTAVLKFGFHETRYPCGSCETQIWVGTREQGVFLAGRRVTPTGQLCSNHVTAIAVSGTRVVVGTFDRGVCWTEGNRWVRAHRPALPSDQVTAVALEGKQLFVATHAGLAHFDGKAWTQVAFGGRNPIGLEKLSVLAAQRTADGLWVMDGRGASQVDPRRGLALVSRVRTPDGWAEHPSLARRAGSSLWFASEDRGLLRFDGTSWARFHDGRDLTDNWVTALSVDDAGRAVVGSCTTGFSYFDGATWTRVPTGLPSPMVTAVALTDGGALIGTLAGVARYDAASAALVPLPELADPRVASLTVVGDELLVGTEGGLSRLRLK